jgi:4-hydroxy-tetrahydrodipicolinate synthase
MKSMKIIHGKKLHGVIPPMVTPLKSENNLDLTGLGKLVEHVISGGIHGLFLLGTTGEGPSLSAKLKYEMVERSCEFIDHRIPVLVGISDSAFSESIKLAEHCAKCGADAVVLAVPYYFPAGQAELLEYLEHLMPKIPLPLFLYNMPAMTKVDIAPETVRKAADINGIVGYKDSSGNMINFHQLIKLFKNKPEFSIFAGAEELLGESVLFGGDGGVPGGANIWPRLFVDMYEAAQNKEMDKILKCQEKIYQLREIYSLGKYSSSFIKGVKCALSVMNICDDFIEEPFHRFRSGERSLVEKKLGKLGLI